MIHFRTIFIINVQLFVGGSAVQKQFLFELARCSLAENLMQSVILTDTHHNLKTDRENVARSGLQTSACTGGTCGEQLTVPSSAHIPRKLGTGSLRNPFCRLSVSTRKTRVSASVPVRLMLQEPGSRLSRRPHHPSRGQAGAHRMWPYISEAEVEVSQSVPLQLGQWCCRRRRRRSSERGRDGGMEGGGRCLSLCAQRRRIPGPKFKFKRKGETGCNSGRQLRIRGR